MRPPPRSCVRCLGSRSRSTSPRWVWCCCGATRQGWRWCSRRPPASTPPPLPTSASPALMTCMSSARPAARGSSPASLTIHGACATSWSSSPAATGWHSANGSHSLAYAGRSRERTDRTDHPFGRATEEQQRDVHSHAERGYASSRDCRVNCGLRSADRRGRRAGAPAECSVWGAQLTDGRCPPESCWMTMRSSRRPARDSAGGVVDGCGPNSDRCATQRQDGPRSHQARMPRSSSVIEAALQPLLHPYLHWVQADGQVVRGRANVIGMLQAIGLSGPPSDVSVPSATTSWTVRSSPSFPNRPGRRQSARKSETWCCDRQGRTRRA